MSEIPFELTHLAESGVDLCAADSAGRFSLFFNGTGNLTGSSNREFPNFGWHACRRTAKAYAAQ